MEGPRQVWYTTSRMLEIVQSFHDDMRAELKINGKMLDGEIRVTNGLRQRYTMAPILFNAVVEAWPVH